jgi:hypothetical protein
MQKFTHEGLPEITDIPTTNAAIEETIHSILSLMRNTVRRAIGAEQSDEYFEFVERLPALSVSIRVLAEVGSQIARREARASGTLRRAADGLRASRPSAATSRRS